MAAFAYSLFFFLAICFCLSPCTAVLHAYIPVVQQNVGQEMSSLQPTFTLAFILSFLTLSHGIRLSLRHLKRILRKQGLFRRRNYSNPQEIISAVERELRGSGSSIGYRLMHQRLRNYYGLVVDKENVRLTLKTLDPEGVERRSRQRLKRRKYSTKGPNYIWHIDGYDKLKPFGFCIHGQ